MKTALAIVRVVGELVAGPLVAGTASSLLGHGFLLGAALYLVALNLISEAKR